MHLQEGPIDLVIGVQASNAATAEAYDRMNSAFTGVLQDLVSELGFLRQPVSLQVRRSTDDSAVCPVKGVVARSMWQSCSRLLDLADEHKELQCLTEPLTAMAGVAGAVADHVLAAGKVVPGVEKAWVNNGGDIAVHVTGNSVFNCGIVGPAKLPANKYSTDPLFEEPGSGRQICIRETDGVGGLSLIHI